MKNQIDGRELEDAFAVIDQESRPRYFFVKNWAVNRERWRYSLIAVLLSALVFLLSFVLTMAGYLSPAVATYSSPISFFGMALFTVLATIFACRANYWDSCLRLYNTKRKKLYVT